MKRPKQGCSFKTAIRGQLWRPKLSVKAALAFLIPVSLAVSLGARTVIAPGAKLEKIAGGFAFTEGPTCDRHGNVFFVDQPNNRIMVWSVAGKLSTFMRPSGHANGMCFDAKGDLIACADEHNQLWAIAPDKTVTVLVTNFQGKYLNGPNDVWVAPNGGIYLTDPFYKRKWWDHSTMDLPGQFVFYLSPGRKRFFPVAKDLKKPNGITGTPDGKTLYVADIQGNRTWRYDILPGGSLTNKTLFYPKGSDGMTIDADDDLYLCATGPTNGVTIVNPEGRRIGHVAVPEKWSANVCFGGPDRKTLFITASKSLYCIRMNVRGANPAK
ncbi:MAG: SMP-30/gluconolactonase/LRE family protein [Verrucomicrobia bacterium]|nr:SMP-30/gluconolactonase/LRE family protein [Verrucomicrobiota bacterium]MDE3099149.1 SMP-30/gluconolactonase/LRE family protein [Verrucomicrobiota bacterium]